MSTGLSAAVAVYCFVGWRFFLRRMWAIQRESSLSTAEKLFDAIAAATLLCWAWPWFGIKAAGKGAAHWTGRFASWIFRGDADRFVRIVAGRTREQRRLR